MLENKKIGFLGGGNMADAIIKGLISAEFMEAENIMVSDSDSSKLERLHKEYKIQTTPDNRVTTEKSNIIVIAVKPQIIEKVLSEVADLADNKKLFISVAAGVNISAMENLLIGKRGRKVCVVRTMPNTPSLVLEGATAIAPGTHVSRKDLAIARRIFEAVGITVDVEESQLDAVTGLSGSGPAYIFMVIEALSDAGVKMGLSRETANALTIQTVLGTARLSKASGKHSGELKDMVTSPGGTTISGLHRLEAGGVRASFMDAVENATLRSLELGQSMVKNKVRKSSPKNNPDS